MSYEIRKLGFGETLDTSFRMVRDRFGLFTGLAAVAYLPIMFGAFWLQSSVTPGATSIPGSAWMGFGIAYFVGILLFPLSQIAIYAAITETYLGEQRSMSELLRTGGSLYLVYMGTAILCAIGCMLWSILLIIPGLYFAVRWVLFGPICLVEKKFGSDALSRSSQLVKGAWWRTAGLLFISSILVSIVFQVANLISSFIPYVGWIITALIASVGVAFSSTVLCVLYFSLRCEKEDYDLQVLAAQVGAAS